MKRICFALESFWKDVADDYQEPTTILFWFLVAIFFFPLWFPFYIISKLKSHFEDY